MRSIMCLESWSEYRTTMTYRTELLSENNMMLSVIIILHYLYCLNLEGTYNDK